jgi:hypothetical protein
MPKQTKLKKKPKKKLTVTKAKALAWAEFSTWIRLRDSVATTGTLTELICYTCGNRVRSFGMGGSQAGHYIPGRGNAYIFDPRQVHGQCPRCNIFDHGNWPSYHEHMIKDWGLEEVNKMLAKRHEVYKFLPDELELLAKMYKEDAENLRLLHS